MDFTKFETRIARSGVLLPEDEWRFLSALFAGDDSGISAQLRAAAPDPARLFTTLSHHGLSGWALDRAKGAMADHDALQATLRAGESKEFAACALRRFALHQLDEACAGCAAPPIIIKGAANAIHFHARESTRPSHDIDVMLAADDAARCFPASTQARSHDQPAWGPAHHAAPFKVAGYEVELHQFLVTPHLWGQYAHLRASAEPLPGFKHLHRVGSVEALTISLLHYNFHVGSFTYDVFDLDRIVVDPSFSWDRAEALWNAHALTAKILPALALFLTLCPNPDTDRWRRLYQELPRRQRLEVAIGLRLLCAKRFTRLRKDWFCTRLTGWSLFWPLVGRIAGSPSTTREITGRDGRDPRFWFFHYLALPAKRLLLFWR